MKQYNRTFLFDYLMGDSSSKRWYKFQGVINKLIKRDLKNIRKNSEVSNVIGWSKKDWNIDQDEPVVIIKGKFETYWRVYFINRTNSHVVYQIPNGGSFIEDLNTSYDDINNIWQKDKFPSTSDYYTSTSSIEVKMNHLQFINKWLHDNTEKVRDENGCEVVRLK